MRNVFCLTALSGVLWPTIAPFSARQNALSPSHPFSVVPSKIGSKPVRSSMTSGSIRGPWPPRPRPPRSGAWAGACADEIVAPAAANNTINIMVLMVISLFAFVALTAAEVKHLGKGPRNRTVVGVRRHDLAHVRPPSAADIGRRDGRPPFFALDLRIGEEIARRRIDEDRVAQHAVRLERVGQLLPDGIVAALVLVRLPVVDRHAKGFTNHQTIPAPSR